MPTAYSILPDRFDDGRHKAMCSGLRRAGYTVQYGSGSPRDDRDVLITWTIHKGHKENQAKAFEQAGGKVIVAEEAYIRIVNGEKCFALALHEHNGAGKWFVGGPERWSKFGIELKPWQFDGEVVLLTEQRGIGSSYMASPPDFVQKTVEKLTDLTRRAIIVRYHPKTRIHPDRARAQPELGEQLKNSHALVTWASAAGVAALIAGVPVFYMAPRWICESAALHDLMFIEQPTRGDRLPAFEKLAWAQWRRSEIESGEAFKCLLQG